MKDITDEFSYAVQHSPQLLRDPQIMQYIQSLGAKLAKHASAGDTSMTFFVIGEPTINAFAGPGGYIGINSGLVLATSSESELASVLAHEIAHIDQKHYLSGLQMAKSQRIPMIASTVAALALSVINPALGSGVLAATMTSLYQSSINFTRANEKVADRVGIKILHDAGYDPASMIGFFQKVQQTSRYYYTQHIPPYLRTHPLDRERIADALNRLDQYPAQTYANSIDYQLFKERIRVQTEKNPNDLIPYYKDKLSQQKEDVALLYGYTLVLLEIREHAQALRQMQQLVEQHPNKMNLQTTLIDIYLANGQTELGLTRLHELTHIYPDNYPLLYQYINALVKYGQPQQAREILQQAVYKYPEDPDLWEKLARAQAADKHEAEAYFSRGQALLLQGNAGYALNQFKQALKLAQGNRLLTAKITSRIAKIESGNSS
ncbi:MAG: M48 family metalloprotease [Gammaproteobacteria bacterium]